MAVNTLVEIINQACEELGLPSVTAVIGNLDPTVVQMKALSARVGDALVKAFDWTELEAIATFSTVSGTENYNAPSDFDRIIPQTEWDRKNHWRLIGPDTPQMDRFRRDGFLNQSGPRRSYRQFGNVVRIWPTPTSTGDTLGYLYISKNFVRTGGTTPAQVFTTDADTTVFDQFLFVSGLKYQFLAAKGMDTGSAAAEYGAILNERKAADGVQQKLNMSPVPANPIIDYWNVPDANYG